MLPHGQPQRLRDGATNACKIRIIEEPSPSSCAAGVIASNLLANFGDENIFTLRANF
jgi:hypothetical protein